MRVAWLMMKRSTAESTTIAATNIRLSLAWMEMCIRDRVYLFRLIFQ